MGPLGAVRGKDNQLKCVSGLNVMHPMITAIYRNFEESALTILLKPLLC